MYNQYLKDKDVSITQLLDCFTIEEELERNGKLENTVIAMFADHYPYGLTNNTLNQYFDYDVTVDMENSMNIEKTLKLFESDNKNGILKINAFPYLQYMK